MQQSATPSERTQVPNQPHIEARHEGEIEGNIGNDDTAASVHLDE